MIGYLLIGASLYALIGGLVALIFLVRWRGTFDSAAAASSWGFRLAVFPGLVALWPVILAKRYGLIRIGEAESPISSNDLRSLHGVAVLVLVVTVPPLFWFALAGREEVRFTTVEAINPHQP